MEIRSVRIVILLVRLALAVVPHFALLALLVHIYMLKILLHASPVFLPRQCLSMGTRYAKIVIFLVRLAMEQENWRANLVHLENTWIKQILPSVFSAIRLWKQSLLMGIKYVKIVTLLARLVLGHHHLNALPALPEHTWIN